MKRGSTIALVMAGLLTLAPRLPAQAPAGGDAAGSGQSKAADGGQKPANAPAPAPSNGNAFPEDTTSVPVLPSSGTPVLPEGTYNGSDSERAKLPGEDTDPVRSPEDPASSADSGDSSSSLAGLGSIVPAADDDQTDKKRKLSAKDQPYKESASNDESVGKYYLDTKNWKAALSRFQSAMVLDPENPEVYWGLAEADRHLSDFADARAYYEKLLDYDPEGPHGKDARKVLKDPQIANAKTPSIGQAAVPTK